MGLIRYNYTTFNEYLETRARSEILRWRLRTNSRFNNYKLKLHIESLLIALILT
jgi:hypothetical protein